MFIYQAFRNPQVVPLVFQKPKVVFYILTEKSYVVSVCVCVSVCLSVTQKILGKSLEYSKKNVWALFSEQTREIFSENSQKKRKFREKMSKNFAKIFAEKCQKFSRKFSRKNLEIFSRKFSMKNLEKNSRNFRLTKKHQEA